MSNALRSASAERPNVSSLARVRFAMLAAAAQLSWQVASLDIDNAENCLSRFRSNRDFTVIVLGAMVVDTALAAIF